MFGSFSEKLQQRSTGLSDHVMTLRVAFTLSCASSLGSHDLVADTLGKD